MLIDAAVPLGYPPDMSGTTPVRTRFAPSPSGNLHVGGARTALFCWAWARQHGGTFVLRIEDTDQKRSSVASGEGFLRDFAWMGITWDEGPEYEDADADVKCGGGEFGPYFQSQRLDLYRRYLDQLIDAGHAYRAFETPEELAEKRNAARAEKRPYRYDGASRDLDPADVAARVERGDPHVIRVRLPKGDVTFQDLVRDEVTVAEDQLEDFVICKADGFPTYHFAVVVDDELMNVSHVIRAQEHLYNTPKHVVLQDLLGFTRPQYAHISLIFNPDGSKMSKRDKDKTLRAYVKQQKIESSPAIDAERWAWWLDKKDHQLDHAEAEALATALDVELPEINVDDFRRAGYLPSVLCNYLALLGWSPGNDIEQFDLDFLTKTFSLDRIVKSPAKFDRDKLLAFNLDAIQAMDRDEFAAKLHAYCESEAPEFIASLSPEGFRLMADANHERSKTLRDPLKTSRFLIESDDAIAWPDTKPIRKALTKGDPCGYDHLERVRGVLAAINEDGWTAEALEAAVTADAETHAEGRLGNVAQPIRVAVSGGTVSPPIFDTLMILGRPSVLARIDRCLAQRQPAAS